MPWCICWIWDVRPPAASPASWPKAAISSRRTGAPLLGSDLPVDLGQPGHALLDLLRSNADIGQAKVARRRFEHEVRPLDELDPALFGGVEHRGQVGAAGQVEP